MSNLEYRHYKEHATETVEVLCDGELLGEIHAVSGWRLYYPVGAKMGEGESYPSLQACKDALELQQGIPLASIELTNE